MGSVVGKLNTLTTYPNTVTQQLQLPLTPYLLPVETLMKPQEPSGVTDSWRTLLSYAPYGRLVTLTTLEPLPGH